MIFQFPACIGSQKLFAIFCAVCLLPSFSAQAWVGGPFSNNNSLGLGGEDGVYEAVATAENTVGFIRIVIGNNFEGVNPPTPSSIQDPAPSIIQEPASGNVMHGALGNLTNTIWYSEGFVYAGRAFGSILFDSQIRGISAAADYSDLFYSNTNLLTSTFTAGFENTGPHMSGRRFSGLGIFSRFGVNPVINSPMVVYGAKVSHRILCGN